MRCPRCHSKVENVRSGVDGAVIRVCSNDGCDWEVLPEKADAEAENQYFNRAEYRPHAGRAFTPDLP